MQENQSGVEGLDARSRWTPDDAPPAAKEAQQAVGSASGFAIGPGVKDAMDSAGDVARSSEQYFHDTNGAVLYSETQGRDAIYRWTPQDGTKRLPFE